MENTVHSEKFGEIVYDENFWTGKKKITINGEELEKVSRKEFKTKSGEQVLIKGNFVFGAKLEIGGETVQVIPTVKWYEIVLAIIPFLLIMIWGNSVPLVRLVPVVGGAIGGGISGLFSAASLCLMKSVKPLWLKILIGVIFIGVTFGVCCGIGIVIVSLL